MNNPTESTPKPRKEEILDVATRHFAERGYEGTSMNDVAEAVGVRKASLFYHFETKEALYEAVIDRLIATIATPLGAAYEAEGTWEERLVNAADTVTSVLAAHPYAARLLLREAMDWGPIVRGKMSGQAVAVLEMSAAFIRAGQEAGVFAKADARQIMVTLIGLHFVPFALGQLVEQFTGKQPFDPQFIEERRAAVRRQVRDMVVGTKG
ncbi:MAG TPA: TetR/AcrR family transcriptional regulator [Polyangiaceae bacterium]|nr:TetR/AcrR family transcriptional regulator [Polyangiaceae bacterium]